MIEANVNYFILFLLSSHMTFPDVCPTVDAASKDSFCRGVRGEYWGVREGGVFNCCKFSPMTDCLRSLPGEAAHQLIVPPEQTILDYFYIVQDILNYSTFLTHILPQVGHQKRVYVITN